MCGICGIIGEYQKETLERMCNVISHRGPDDFGYYHDSIAGLGHRRLSIIDLSGGHQPMTNEDRSLWLVFNGEIYNYQGITQELISKGHTFQTRSDTETILHAYEEYGTECVKKMRGMFAFALWDTKKEELFLVRDRLGIKPLYYIQLPDKLLFASEIKSLLQHPQVTPQLDELALDRFFSFRFTPGENTVFRQIKKLLPGHFLVYRHGKLRIEKYWDIQFQPDHSLSLDDFTHALQDKLKESIRLRLISEVPLGAYLSGGLDSSFIVGLMSQLSEKPVETFSVGFADGKYNELNFAQIVADRFHTQHHTLYAEESSADLLDQITWYLDEPLADAAVIPTYLMAKLTKQFVTVVLSGEGADEMLAGYAKYKILHYIYAIKYMPFLSIWNKLAYSVSNHIDIQRIVATISSANNRAKAYAAMVSVFSPEDKNLLYTDKFKNIVAQQEPLEQYLKPYFESGEDSLNQLMLLDIKTWLPDDLLLKNDKMTMAHAVEARVPYLDHELVELMATIPSQYKLHWGKGKYIQRKAMQGLVPKEILQRKKTGFTVPLGNWFNDEKFKSKVHDLLLGDDIRELGYFKENYIKELLGKNLNNQYYRRQFWALFTFALWYRIFILKTCKNNLQKSGGTSYN
ncbi:MAG: asparagine synthase (glutamine-hydrolyzing) [Candidatus Schekmanbacteria bacterium]|nr:asparagine synthase (glutamine-hydrolyzing) [Candidatus Schekmanbacteria bacterium]